MDSTRLPGKALLALDDVPVLGRVLNRLNMCRELDGIVVCTSTRAIDDPIADYASKAGVQLVRGDTFDVLGRANAAMTMVNADAAVRISGDSPFVDPALVDKMVALHRQTPCDLTTNVHPRTFPAGMSIEVIQAQALAKLDQKSLSAEDREHVTTYFYRHADQFEINNHAATTPCRDVDLALDTEDDFAFQNWLGTQIADDANLNAIIAAARLYPERRRKDAS